VVFKAVYAACRPMTRLGLMVQRFVTFETPSSTDQAPQVADCVFKPTTFIDVEPLWERKLEALACYPTEMIGGEHRRSFSYIERWPGCAVGTRVTCSPRRSCRSASGCPVLRTQPTWLAGPSCPTEDGSPAARRRVRTRMRRPSPTNAMANAVHPLRDLS
jgi:hypothetical protein